MDRPTRETGPAAWPSSWATTRWSRPRPPTLGLRRRRYRTNEIERFFCRLKRFRRIATRYDKLDVIFLSLIYLALIYDALQSM